MFTGLIQAIGTLLASVPFGNGRSLTIDLGGLPHPPTIGASIAVSGVCLTVTALRGREVRFDAVAETIARSTLGRLPVGSRVNLEPALRVGDPLDGHLVQGHVDTTAKILALTKTTDSLLCKIELPPSLQPLVAEKGSIAVDGVSLTVVEVDSDSFSVSLIPHTISHTTLGERRVGDLVNLEADILARYVARQQRFASPGVTEQLLRDHGFLV